MRQLKVVSAITLPQWYKDMTKPQQKQYLIDHPNSKIAKDIKSNSPAPKAAPKKPVAKKPAAVDRYKDVPVADKKVMQSALKRGHVVPPAWRNVWLNPDPKGDLQVKGTAANGKVQYLYSVKHNTMKAAQKFGRLKQFNKAHPVLMKRIEKDMDNNEAAKVLYLVSKTGFRIDSGNDTGTVDYKAVGASSLTDKHVKVKGNKVDFDFIGKEGVRQQHSVTDAKIAAMVKGKKGKIFNAEYKDVYKYMKDISKDKFTIKDFRTKIGTETALSAMEELGIEKPSNEREYNKAVTEVCKVVADKLGNTPTMAKNSYVDPTVFKSWAEGIEFKKKVKKTRVTSSKENDMSGAELLKEHLSNNSYQFNRNLVNLYRKYKNTQSKQVHKELVDLCIELDIVKEGDTETFNKVMEALSDYVK